MGKQRSPQGIMPPDPRYGLGRVPNVYNVWLRSCFESDFPVVFLGMAHLTGQLCCQLVLTFSTWGAFRVNGDIPKLAYSAVAEASPYSSRKTFMFYTWPSTACNWRCRWLATLRIHLANIVILNVQAIAASIACCTAAVAAHPCTSVITRGEDGWCCSPSRRRIWMRQIRYW